MRTLTACWVKAYALTFCPSMIAPGAPMNVELSPGTIWLDRPDPSVCTPGANQYVVPAVPKFIIELSPAATLTAAPGAVLGPSSNTGLSQILAGGVVG